jgi:hypothetical protein
MVVYVLIRAIIDSTFMSFYSIVYSLFVDLQLSCSMYSNIIVIQIRVSCETSFDSKQPKLEPKLVSALSETKRLFRLFPLQSETASFGVSVKPKLTETNRNKLKTMERTRPSAA